ncbi:hypothetical protein ACFL1X_08045 [Candidatus Hydrogenedentota bacterium]
MPGKKSTIPPSAQIPAMIALAILFVIILVWRFAPKEEAGQDGAAAVSGAAAQEVSLDDLNKIIEEMNKGEIQMASRSDEIPTLVRNPFSIPESALAAIREGEVGRLTRDFKDAKKEEVQVEIHEVGPDRDEILSSFELTTICKMGNVKMAIVNDSFLKEGDKLSGFVVEEIGEREIVLMDDKGTETIRMEETPLL